MACTKCNHNIVILSESEESLNRDPSTARSFDSLRSFRTGKQPGHASIAKPDAKTTWPLVRVTTESEDNMPTITLPDGSQKLFESPVTVHQVAESIGPGLAKAALAGRVGDTLVDTSHTVEEDTELGNVERQEN